MPLVYSTGPLENQIDATAAKSSTSVYTKVLNNHEHTTITAKIKVFRLDGTKTLIDTVGLLMTTFPITMAIVAPLSGHASDKFGPVALTTGGLVITALGLFYYSILTPAATFYQVIPGGILTGLGAGMFQSPNNSSVMSSVPKPKLGIAGGINSLVRNLGMVSGIAFSVSLFEAWGGVTSPKPNEIGQFMSAYHSVMLVAMAIALVGAVISLNRKSYAKAEG